MKRLNGTTEDLTKVNQTIVEGMNNAIPGFSASSYSAIQTDTAGSFIVLDEGDSRNPLQYLTDEQRESLTDYIPPKANDKMP
jgi:hypothetical protein